VGKFSAENRSEKFFGRSLSDRACNGDEGDGKLTSPRRSHFSKRVEGVVHGVNESALGFSDGASALADNASGALVDRLVYKSMTIKVIAFQRNEEAAGLYFSRIRCDRSKAFDGTRQESGRESQAKSSSNEVRCNLWFEPGSFPKCTHELKLTCFADLPLENMTDWVGRFYQFYNRCINFRQGTGERCLGC